MKIKQTGRTLFSLAAFTQIEKYLNGENSVNHCENQKPSSSSMMLFHRKQHMPNTLVCVPVCTSIRINVI